MSTQEYESVAMLQLWKELEGIARHAEASLNKKLIAYFRGMSPAPEPEDYTLTKRTRAVADRQFAKIFKTPARQRYRRSR